MKSWMVRVAAPFWAALYVVIFKMGGATIFIALEVLWGVWAAVALMVCLYGIWGTLFYIILLQSDSFEHLKGFLDRFLEKKKSKVFVWIRKRFVEETEISVTSPLLIMLVFIAESPLTGVPLIRFDYPKEKFWLAIFWIWVGSLVEVATWFLPVYGGGISVVRGFLSWLGWG